MKTDKNSQIVIYVIKGSTIRRFVILDLIIGAGIFYVVKLVSLSVLAASVSSFMGTEGIKRATKILNKSNVKKKTIKLT